MYSVSSGGMSFAGSFLLTHRPRSGTGAISPDGQRLYVPVQAAGTPFDNFIAVCDIAPGSPTFNREIGLIPVPVVGPGRLDPSRHPSVPHSFFPHRLCVYRGNLIL